MDLWCDDREEKSSKSQNHSSQGDPTTAGNTSGDSQRNRYERRDSLDVRCNWQKLMLRRGKSIRQAYQVAPPGKGNTGCCQSTDAKDSRSSCRHRTHAERLEF